MKKEKPELAMIAPDTKGREEHDYEAQTAADDIMRAERHKSNKPLMKRVVKHLHKKKKDVITSLQQLREVAAQKRDMGNDDNDEDDM